MAHDKRINLDLPKFQTYYLLKSEQDLFPDLLASFKNFLDLRCQSRFLGYIDSSKGKQLEVGATIYVTAEFDFKIEGEPQLQVSRVVLYDDFHWGKLSFFAHMLQDSDVSSKFDIVEFRKAVGSHRGKTLFQKKLSCGPFYLARQLLLGGRRYPSLHRVLTNVFGGYIYGHSGGYAREQVFYDLSFRKKLKKVLQKLSNEASKKSLKLVTLGSVEDIWRYYFNAMQKNPQYADYISLNKGATVINCGVECGFEIPLFISMGAEKIYHIDPSGSGKLNQYARTWVNKTIEKHIFIDKWLYTSECDPNTTKITTTLSGVIEEQNISRIDLVKADIEGAERDMVVDLVCVMQKYRPQLAISIYHSQSSDKSISALSDIVDIPLALIKGAKDYNFFIDFYSYERWEIVFYAIPKECSNKLN